ncbi:2Fe-2S iron-sulfur cluster-binding protein [Billgrantia bachuensis]|uniref:(2Fe-2S)-binding protein n=1 Tax=Billgrantia bachuensis TaxID=2717286 RepID=A0ABX0PUE0_9GAMM|nr:2Fe-2S iron-sulfur cluster-binding protein [Halomonas bachuensis]NIC05064.1 (2Fe-2S)-binding protein [Halomonas bachuensis]
MPDITFITNDGKVVSAPKDSNLLRVSLREKGGIPFKCGGGLCGTCKCLLEEGRENTDAVKKKEEKLLSAEELEQGYRLACQTFLKGDIKVSWEETSKGGATGTRQVRPKAEA